MSTEEAIVNAIANAAAELRAELHTGFAELSGKIDQTNTRLDQTNARLDRFEEETSKKLDGISQFLIASERGNSMLESRIISLEIRVLDIEGKQKPA